MREIKFRGIPLFGDKFVYGSLIVEKNEKGENAYTIKRNENSKVHYFEVKPESVGQYTGFKLKDVKVYEADIIKARKDFLYEVKFEDGAFSLYHLNKYEGTEQIKWGLLYRLFASDMEDILNQCEVIGNIYTHRFLLDNNKGEI